MKKKPQIISEDDIELTRDITILMKDPVVVLPKQPFIIKSLGGPKGCNLTGYAREKKEDSKASTEYSYNHSNNFKHNIGKVLELYGLEEYE